MTRAAVLEYGPGEGGRMYWEVRNRDTGFVVEADHWLAAVHATTEQLGLPEAVRARIVAQVQQNGVLRIHDPRGSLRLLARLLPEDLGEDDIDAEDLETEDYRTAETEEVGEFSADVLDGIREAALSRVQPLDADPLMHLQAQPTAVVERSLGGPVQPVPAAVGFSIADLNTLQEHIPDLDFTDDDTSEVIEELFMRCAGIASACDPADAARQALAILVELIPATDAAVMYAGVNATGLGFLATHGDKAAAMADVVLPFGSGLAGYVFDTGRSVLVSGATAPPTRSVAEHTAASGSVLAVPVRDDLGHTFGVIEMLDAPQGFETWHLHATENVAVTLAQYLQSQLES